MCFHFAKTFFYEKGCLCEWCVHVYACERAPSDSSVYEGLSAVRLGSPSLCKTSDIEIINNRQCCSMQYLLALHGSGPETNLLLPMGFSGCHLCSCFWWSLSFLIILEQELPQTAYTSNTL